MLPAANVKKSRGAKILDDPAKKTDVRPVIKIKFLVTSAHEIGCSSSIPPQPQPISVFPLKRLITTARVTIDRSVDPSIAPSNKVLSISSKVAAKPSARTIA